MSDWESLPLDRAGWDGEREEPLWTADSPEALWQVLATRLTGRESTRYQEAVSLFAKHHEDGRQGALDTALLLCTDHRWYRCSGKVITGVEGAGILSNAEVAALADRFLWEDSCAYSYPLEWASPGGLMVEMAGRLVQVDPKTPVPTRRTIRGPLRRWAAANVVRRAPDSWQRVLARAGGLGSDDGGFVLLGMLDAVERLDAAGAEDVVACAVSWPKATVRRLGLQVVAKRRGAEVARKMGADDPDASVRKLVARFE